MCNCYVLQEEQSCCQEISWHSPGAGKSAEAEGALPGECKQGAHGADGEERLGDWRYEVSSTKVFFNFWFFSEKDWEGTKRTETARFLSKYITHTEVDRGYN